MVGEDQFDDGHETITDRDGNHHVGEFVLIRPRADELGFTADGVRVGRKGVDLLPEGGKIGVARDGGVVEDTGRSARLHVQDPGREPSEVHIQIVDQVRESGVEVRRGRGELAAGVEKPVVDLLLKMEKPCEPRVRPVIHDPVNGHLGELPEHGDLELAQLLRLPVDDAEGAERNLLPVDQRNPCVEADVGFSGDEGIGGEAGILAQVPHDEGLLRVENRMGADGDIPGSLLHRKSVGRLEPLTLLVDQRDQCDRRFADHRRYLGETIEHGVVARVEDLVPHQFRDPSLLVGRQGSGCGTSAGQRRYGLRRFLFFRLLRQGG